MPRGVRKPVEYKGEALKISEKINKLKAELSVLQKELKIAYKKQKQEEAEAKKKEEQEKQKKIWELIKESGKTPDEIIAFLQGDKKE